LGVLMQWECYTPYYRSCYSEQSLWVITPKRYKALSLLGVMLTRRFTCGAFCYWVLVPRAPREVGRAAANACLYWSRVVRLVV
jgi:hypothetical protein